MSGSSTASPHLTFFDRIVARGAHTATVRIHLAPDIALRPDGSSWLLLDRTTPFGRLSSNGLEWTEVRTPYHPEFGLEIERPCLQASVTFDDDLSLRWALTLGEST